MRQRKIRNTITPKHRSRRAVVYVRRATAPHTGHDHANLDDQRAQRQHAYRWGWAPETVQVIDDDIGQGGQAHEHRSGFHRLCGTIALGDVGMVLVFDPSRLSRSAADFARLLALCRQADTLIAADGVLVDGTDPSEDFVGDIHRAIAEFENRQRTARRKRQA